MTVDVPTGAMFLEFYVGAQRCQTCGFASYIFTPYYQSFVDPTCPPTSSANMSAICSQTYDSGDWQLPQAPPGTYALAFEYLGATNGTGDPFAAEANFTVRILAAAQSTPLTGSERFMIDSLAPEQTLIYGFRPRVILGGYGKYTITATPSATVSAAAPVLVLTLAGGHRFASYSNFESCSPCVPFQRNDVDSGLNSSNVANLETIPWQGWASDSIWDNMWQGWFGCFNGSSFVNSMDPTLYVSLYGLGGTENSTSIALDFTFQKVCDPNTLCPEDYKGPVIAVVLMFILYVIMIALASHQWQHTVATASPLVRQRAIASVVILGITAAGYWVVLFMPIYYFTSIPQLVLIACYILGVALLNYGIVLGWAIMSIINALWLIIFIFVLFLLALASALGGNSTKVQDTSLEITTIMTIINLVICIVNIIMSWVFYCTIKDGPGPSSVDLDSGHATSDK